ncbi:metal ABC transporter permease [Hydrogenovibrio thermophilus]|jgi:ABC-type Mn2+/Zn2+ transport systems, permease components|uniref:Metal ABC transporter permease n=1 Tax=Hydrogenovibrio thermophilus TaxID=265883 RepID=A0A410H5T8_9GAMM|nr:metal ABC transporter permease [Hydrogenovibrio thermophilus]QAB16292.1 metal ABC transporter permease [Hydrogenovibrio thermophilus]
MMGDIWILATASLVAVSCSMVGVFLVLRRMSLLGDAISHSVLLGIVLAYLAVGSRSVVAMMIGATVIGLLTAWLSNTLHRVSKLQTDASIGIIFTWFFAVGVILISVYAGQVDLDQECVLYGEIAFVPFDTVVWGESDIGPRAFWLILGVFLLNLLMVLIGFERFKLVAFHPALAVSLGVNVVFWHYLLMTMVSLTTVASFDAVGAILVVALLVIPASAAYLLAKSLKGMLWLAAGYAQLSVLAGYAVAVWLDSSIAASIAVMAGLLLMTTVLVLQVLKTRRQGRLVRA